MDEEIVKNTFDFPTLHWDKDDYDKMVEFHKFCFSPHLYGNKCLNCGRRYSDACKQEGTNNLVLECDNCLSNDVLSDPQTQKLVAWMEEKLLDAGGISFENGFPILPEINIQHNNKLKFTNDFERAKLVKKSSSSSSSSSSNKEIGRK